MLLALAQFKASLGDFARNLDRARSLLRDPAAQGADLVVFPEFTLLGYPPKDWLLRPDFVAANLRALESLARDVGPQHVIVGFAEPNPSPRGRGLFNSLAVLHAGRVVHVYRKQLLPTYAEFDELRYFEPGDGSGNLLDIAGRRVGLSICEDLWCEPPAPGQRCLYHADPVDALAGQKPDLLVNISASPFTLGKGQSRPALFARQARRLACPVLVVNSVGGRDSSVFDGNSCAVSPDGSLLAHCKEFAEDLLVFSLDKPGRIERPSRGMAAIFNALVFAVRELYDTLGVARAVIDLDAGLPAAVAAVIAARALDGNLYALGDSRAALSLARKLAIPIHPIPGFSKASAQERNCVLMGDPFSLTLSSSTKTDLAIGQDIAGGLGVLADLTNLQVRQLAEWINSHIAPLIPRSLLNTPNDDALDRRLDSTLAGKRPSPSLLHRIDNHQWLRSTSGCVGIKVTPSSLSGLHLPTT